MYINEQINKQTNKKESTRKKETITCDRPVDIAHHSHKNLGLCRKHFATASKIIISRIKAGLAVLYSFTWQFKAEKRVTVIYNVFIVCFE